MKAEIYELKSGSIYSHFIGNLNISSVSYLPRAGDKIKTEDTCGFLIVDHLEWEYENNDLIEVRIICR